MRKIRTRTEELDREANYFAMCLLMPEEMVRREVKKLGGIDLIEGPAILAKIFKVSESLMAFRLCQIYEAHKL